MKPELPKILVVDDEPRALELLTRSLRRRAQISTATSGEQALQLFAANRFLLVIADQRMPGMSGVDLLGRIAEIDDSTGRILLTGYADLDATVAAINRGRVHAYLHKPCSPPDLISTLKTVTDRVQLARENARLRAEIRAEDRRDDGAVSMDAAARLPGSPALLTCLRSTLCDLDAFVAGLSARVDQMGDEQLARLVREGQRLPEALLDIFRQLLEFKLPNGVHCDPERLAVDEAVAASVEASTEVASIQGVFLDVRLRAGIDIHIERWSLMHALDELILNALEAMPGGGMLCIETLRDGDDALIRFSDTGEGLPRELADQVFQPFVGTSPTVGRGLGLPIVARIAADHGGSLKFSKADGGGTMISLRLPCAPA